MNEQAAGQIVTELFRDWYAAMVRFAARSLGSVELAEELVQDAFLALYRDLTEGRFIEHPRAWVMRIIRRRVWQHYAQQPRTESLDVIDELRERWRPPEQEPGELAVLLQALSPREEEAVLLRAAGLAYAEIAQELGVETGTISTLLARALRKMQTAAGTAPAPPTRERRQKGVRHEPPETLQ